MGVAPLDRRIAWAVAVTAMLTMTVSYVDRSTLAVLSVTVTKALAIDEAGYGWITAAFSFAYLIATPLAGWWLDRYGARRGLFLSVLVWSAVAAMHAAVPTFGVLIALRVALGFAEGPGFPGAAQTVSRVLPPGDRPRGYGMLFMGSSIGSTIAPPLAALVFWLAGWRMAFVITAVVGLAWIPLWLMLTDRADVRAQLDAVPPRSVRSSAWSVLIRPTMIRALIGVLAIAPVLALGFFWGAKYLHATFGVDQEDVGKYLWLPPMFLDAGAFGFGDLLARLRRPRLLFAIAAALGASIALLAIVDGPWQGIAVACLAMAGGGAVYTLATSELLARTPPAQVSVASGIVACAQSVAFVVVNPLIGAALDAQYSYATIAVALAAWVVPGAIVWIVWRPTLVSPR